ncbi:MAG: ABC transporter permease, partial [Candidatus Brockarchaeota archaeon]|nr:ABC transporter permease [Candidatus Brockarchaeota archaeon]
LYGALGYVLTPRFLLCLGILAVGLAGVYGFSLLVGSLVLRLKEAFSLLVIFQMLFGILMGVFYPVSFLPYGLSHVSYLLPMTIALNDMRAALLSTQYVSSLYLDLAAVALQSSLYLLAGFAVLKKSERKIREGTGLASF